MNRDQINTNIGHKKKKKYYIVLKKSNRTLSFKIKLVKS